MKNRLLLFVLGTIVALSSCKKEDPVVNVQSVSLNQTTCTLTVGDKATLTAIVAPADAFNKKVIWNSSPAGIVTVVEGVVTAAKEGVATVTVTTEEGKKTAACKVTVTPVLIPANGVSIAPTTLSLKIGGTSKLIATVAPDNASNKKVEWSSNAPAVASVNKTTGEVKAETVGRAIITATTEDGKKTAGCEVMVREAIASAFSVGDYYPKGTNKETAMGVVFWLDPLDNTTGKIVSMDEGDLCIWGPFNAATADAKDEYNGAINMKIIKKIREDLKSYPALSWCNSKNTSKTTASLNWYLPAKKELRILYAAMSGLMWIPEGEAVTIEIADWEDFSNMPDDEKYEEARIAFNSKFTTPIAENYYWSSTAYQEITAWAVSFVGGYAIASFEEEIIFRVRAVSAF